MAHRYAQLAFTDEVRKIQTKLGSRQSYQAMDQGEDVNYLFSQIEADFIQQQDSFYMASVSETGWPYVQHRGGPKGFMQVLDAKTLGFADYRGNRQYVSTGNFVNNKRVSIIFMDYPNRRRLKLLGRVEQVADDDWETLAKLESPSYRARVERGFIIHVEAFDWNCPQHITRRYPEADVEKLLLPLQQQVNELTQKLRQQPTASKPALQSVGDGPLALTITGIRQLTPRIRAYELRAADGRQLPEVSAGSHLAIPVLLANGQQGMRQYSICSNPARRDIYEIAVQKQQDGNGGSVAVHEQFQLGTELHCQLPQNHFALNKADKVFLVAGGIGITPIKAMVQELKAQGRAFHLHYAGKSRQDMAFSQRLQLEFGEHISLYESTQGQRVKLSELMSQLKENEAVYICGPQSMVDEAETVRAQLGLAPSQVVSERFAAKPDSDATEVKAKLQQSGVEIMVPAEQSILDAAIAAGIDAPHSCRTGECRTCVTKVIDGDPEHKDQCLTEAERAQGLFCPCVSRAKSSHITLEL